MTGVATSAGTPAALAGMRKRTTGAAKWLSQMAVVLAFGGLWQLFALSPTGTAARVPGPAQTIARWIELMVTADFWQALGATLASWAAAMLICLIVGIPAGMLIGASRKATDSTRFVIDFLRTIPAVALIPLALLVFGPHRPMVVFVAVSAAIWPVIIQSSYAAQQRDPMLRQVARSFRLNLADRLRFVLAPDLLSFIWPGIRLAVTVSLLVAVGAELIGAAPGLGMALQQALLQNRNDSLFAYVLTACSLGLLVNAVLVFIQKKTLWWHPSMRGKGAAK
jgi:ABC-type nitrate/sulfonate/bicarbonate transport system permease component